MRKRVRELEVLIDQKDDQCKVFLEENQKFLDELKVQEKIKQELKTQLIVAKSKVQVENDEEAEGKVEEKETSETEKD